METNYRTGWERDNKTHFDEIVVNYEKARPEYPAQIFADIFDYAGADKAGTGTALPASGGKAVEIGAGTGKATRPFLDAGYDVTAVEIGANMAAFLREKYKDYKNFNVLISGFEDAVLEDGSYDLIYAASAFHWVDAEIGCPKALRLLKSGGAVALIRYNVIPAHGEELYEEIQKVYEKHYQRYHKWDHRLEKRSAEDFRRADKILEGYGFSDLGDYGFTDVSMKLYDTALMFGADEFITYLDTMADHRVLPAKDKEALYAGIREAILYRGGFYREDLVFQLYMGRKP